MPPTLCSISNENVHLWIKHWNGIRKPLIL